MARRILTPEEKALWELAMRDAKPLHQNKDVEMRRCEDEKIRKQQKKITQKNLLISSSYPLLISNYANIDRNTAERFRKGRYPIDATLDMHGMDREAAVAALYDFLHSQYDKGSRCLHVITGKGLILRDMLPHWLANDALRPLLLAFDVAKPKHGGSGAYYILLKRKR